MRRVRTVSILLSLWTLAGCATTRGGEEEPADPTDEATAGVEEAPSAEAEAPAAGAPADAQAPVSGEGGTLGLDLSGDDEPAASTATEGATCPDGRAPLSLKLLVLLRHPTDPVPALPADGFSVAVDGKPAVSGVRVGQVHTLCVAPGDHELSVSGGKLSRSIRASAPGHANLAVAGGGVGPVPDVKPGTNVPVPVKP